MDNEGVLYLVATPIGNLEDMTFRAVRVLREADLIAAEDTRGSIRILNHFDIHTPMTSYHEYNKVTKAVWLVQQLKEGKDIACVTDAGTPGISDPGEVLVKMALDAGIRVVPVPGACAAVSALISSGQSTRRFCFEAFLPTEKKERDPILEELKTETRTIIIYEAPHRLLKTLRMLTDELGDRPLSICRELTKKHEEIRRTTLAEASSYYENVQPKGEYVLVIAGRDRRELKEERLEEVRCSMTLEEHMKQYTDAGLDRKEAMKAVAKDRGMTKREVYSQLLSGDGKSETADSSQTAQNAEDRQDMA